MFSQRFALDVLAVISILSVTPSSAQQPLVIPYGQDSTVGPDGPWNFIRLPVGKDSSSNVDFHPMIGNPASLIVSGDCSSSGKCSTPNPQYFGASLGSTDPYGAKLDMSTVSMDTYDRGKGFIFGESGSGQFWRDTIGSPVNVDQIAMFVTGDVSVSVGSKSYKPISQLSLENSPWMNNPNDTNGKYVNVTTVMEGNFNRGGAGSFGLHPGQAVVGQPGSLTFGGYDSNRIIEQPMVMPAYKDFPLNSITFGTSKGERPWKNLTSDFNFLGTTNSSQNISYTLSPHLPYLYLPSAVCTQMAQFLPVTFDPDTNLYLWNTSDPQYRDIVSSPSYMSFTFNAAPRGSIRVPFAALNMTLSSPLKDSPTPYFPCYPSATLTTLGRAFMQSAFFMHAWTTNSGTYYLAQAPGPSVGKSQKLVALPKDNPVLNLPSNPPSWDDTWKDVLTPLSADKPASSAAPNSANNNANNNGNGANGASGSQSAPSSSATAAANPAGSVSTGAKAGIAVAVILGVSGAVIGAMLLLNYRRRRALRAQGKDASNVQNFGFGFWRHRNAPIKASEVDSTGLIEKDNDAKSFVSGTSGAPSSKGPPPSPPTTGSSPSSVHEFDGAPPPVQQLHGRSRSELAGSRSLPVVHEIGGEHAVELPAYVR